MLQYLTLLLAGAETGSSKNESSSGSLLWLSWCEWGGEERELAADLASPPAAFRRFFVSTEVSAALAATVDDGGWRQTANGVTVDIEVSTPHTVSNSQSIDWRLDGAFFTLFLDTGAKSPNELSIQPQKKKF